MKGKTDPLARHQDHLALVDAMIATTEAAIGKRQHTIRQLLRDGADVSAETRALRADEEALKRLQAERLATLRQISRDKKT
jgi:hypothetical protein